MADITVRDRVAQILGSLQEGVDNPLVRKRWAGEASSAVWKVFRFFLLAGLCFILLYPLIYMVSMAFRPWQEFADPVVVWVPRSYTLENFVFAVDLMDLPESFLVTLTIATVSSLLQIVSCALAGYGFARFSFKFRGVLFACVLFTIIVPPQTYIIPLYLQFRFFDFFGLGSVIGLVTGLDVSVNLLNTPMTFFLPAALGSGIRSGLFIYIFTQFFRGMPRELEDAAHIDGCGFSQTFVWVFVPNSVPAFLTVFFFSFVWYWNDYFFSSMFFSSINTMSTKLAQFGSAVIMLANDPTMNPFKFLVGEQAAALLTIGPVLIMYIFLQRHFTESVERTGIVG